MTELVTKRYLLKVGSLWEALEMAFLLPMRFRIGRSHTFMLVFPDEEVNTG